MSYQGGAQVIGGVCKEIPLNKQDIRIFLRWATIHLGFSSLAVIEAAPPTAELEPIRSDYVQLDEVDMGMTYEELSIYGMLRKIFRCGPVSIFKVLLLLTCIEPTRIDDNETQILSAFWWDNFRPIVISFIGLDAHFVMLCVTNDAFLFITRSSFFPCHNLCYVRNLCFSWGSKLSPSEVADKVKHFFEKYSINRHNMTVLTPSYHVESYSPEDNRFDLRQFLYNSRWPYQFRKIDELVKGLNVDKEASTSNGVGIVAVGAANPKAGL